MGNDLAGILILLMLALLPMTGCVATMRSYDKTYYNLTKEKWECTRMTYPKQEYKDTFTPYCSQYSTMAGE